MQPAPLNTDFSKQLATLVNLPTAIENTLLRPATADDQRPRIRMYAHPSPDFTNYARKHFHIDRTIFTLLFGNVTVYLKRRQRVWRD